MRIAIVLLALAVASIAAAARPSGNAAMVQKLRPTVSKRAIHLLESLGGAVKEQNALGEHVLTTPNGSYLEWHEHGVAHSRADMKAADGKLQVSTSLLTTAKGKLIRQVTIEDTSDRRDVEVLDKHGLLTISRRVAIAYRHDGERTIKMGRTALKLGGLRIPIGRGDGALAEGIEAMNRAGGVFDAWDLSAKLAAPKLPSHADTRDIALGLDHTNGRVSLDAFGETVGATVYTAWASRGITNVGSADPTRFAERFHDAVHKTIERGGRIKFDLTGIDLGRSIMRLGRGARLGSITSWELQQLRTDPQLAAHTDFYRQDARGDYHKLSAKAAFSLP